MDARTIKLSSAVICSAHRSVRVFQNFVTLDLGRRAAELMVGRGSFTVVPAVRVLLTDYDELFVEKLDLLLKLREDQPVTWHGKFRPPLDVIRVYPCQEGRPLLSGSLSAVRRTLSSGRARSVRRWHLRSSVAGLRALRRCRAYRKALEYGEHDPKPCLPYTATATSSPTSALLGDEFLPAYRQTFAKITQGARLATIGCGHRGSDRARGALFFGRPETVADKIIRLHELMYIDRFELHVSHVDHAKTMRSIELLGSRSLRWSGRSWLLDRRCETSPAGAL